MALFLTLVLTSTHTLIMNLNKLLFVGLMLSIGSTVRAQELISAKFKIEDYKNDVQEIELTFSTFVMGMSADGHITFIEPLKRTSANEWDDYNDNPTGGRSRNLGDLKLTYYDNFDKEKAGKIKSVDDVAFDYYTSFDIHDKKGTLKSIGKMAIKYNNSFDIHEVNGSIKFIGNIAFKYNNAFDMHEAKGSLKSIGPVQILWYNSFDDYQQRGKVKSIKGNIPTLYVTKVFTRNDWGFN